MFGPALYSVRPIVIKAIASPARRLRAAFFV